LRRHHPGSTPAPCKRTWNLIAGDAFLARPGNVRSGRNATTENKMISGRIAIAATTLACAALLSLPVERAQAVEKAEMHASHARHMAAAPHGRMRHASRGYYARRGYGPNPVEAGADIAAGAVNTAGAVAAGAIGTAGAIAAAPFGGGPYAAAPGWNEGYYGTSTWGDFDCRPGYVGCQPYSSKDWGRR
jgi:hypothetical protein